MRNYLVVANQTLCETRLLEEVVAAHRRAPGTWHVVVPATPVRHLATWTEGEALGLARGRLAAAQGCFADVGIAITGDVGDANPMLAVADELRRRPADVIVLSTLPAGVSRWLGQDLPERMRQRFGVPVLHVVAKRAPELSGRRSA